MAMNSPPKLSHENLHVYRAAIEFLVLATTLLERFPRGHGPIADQLRRAALSIPLNIAEGYGKRSRDDRSRFYDIARGSAHECGAILDASQILQLIDDLTYSQGKTLLHRIVAMLVKMTVRASSLPFPVTVAASFTHFKAGRDGANIGVRVREMSPKN